MKRARVWTPDNVAPLMTVSVVLALDLFVCVRAGVAQWLHLPLHLDLLVGVGAFSIAVLFPNLLIIELNVSEAAAARRRRAVEPIRSMDW